MAISTLGLGGSGQERYRSSRENRLESMRYRWALLLRVERDGGGGVDAIFYSGGHFLSCIMAEQLLICGAYVDA